MTSVVLLNADYQVLGLIGIKKAFKLMSKGKVIVVKATEKLMHTVTKSFLVPVVLRLVKMVRMMYGKKVPFAKRNVMTLYDGRCGYCGKKDKHMTLDHIIPKSRGGKSEFANVVPSCLKCNNFKDNKTPREAGMVLQYKVVVPTISEFLQISIRNLGLDKYVDEICG